MEQVNDMKPCPFCGHKSSRLMHRTVYRENAEGITAEYYEPDVGFGGGGYHEVKMLDFRHVFYRRCNRCGARSKQIKTDWHVRTEDEAEDFSPYASQREKQWGFDANSEWAKPWRVMANAAWNQRKDDSE